MQAAANEDVLVYKILQLDAHDHTIIIAQRLRFIGNIDIENRAMPNWMELKIIGRR
jgi:hypothetical protein